ncbi:MAG: antibiotic biosynthesis monooxygenase [Actinobacteria bacterium]|nr:antibiotic biosynthesis monooxygenase [Actinomycetota bacterium]
MNEQGSSIGRVWHGWTRPEDAATYDALVTDEVLPGMANLDGFLGAQMMRRDGPDEVEFLVITEWESIDAIKGFAGEDYEKTSIPYDAEQLLSRFDAGPEHYVRRYHAHGAADGEA